MKSLVALARAHRPDARACDVTLHEQDQGTHAVKRNVIALAAVALLLRLAWMLLGTQVIENEGAEYARIASNLLHGAGYVGILGGRQILFPPLYPFLIAGVSFVVRNVELAGRLISILFGSLLVIPVFFIAKRLFSIRAAYLCGFLIALHPLLISLSASVYVESTYLTLLFAGLCCGMNALDRQQLRPAFLSGLFLGLAYLTRPEALAYVLLIATFFFVAVRLRASAISLSLNQAAVMLLTSAIFIVPYATYLSIRSGVFRIEGKTELNGIINTRMSRGMTYLEAACGLGLHSEPEGPFLIADQFSIRAPRTARGLHAAVYTYFLGLPQRMRYIIIAVAADRSFGSPLLCLLVLIGIFRPNWRLRAWMNELLLLNAACLTLFILVSLRFVWNRYLWPFLPFLLLWAGAGTLYLGQWTATYLSKWFARRTTTLVISVTLTTALLLIAFRGVLRDPEFMQARNLYVKDAGKWLNQYRVGSKNIMAIGSTLPFYANGTEFYLPYADSARALVYIHSKHPDFIVLRADELGSRPYSTEWFGNGIPDTCAHLIGPNGNRLREKVRIFEWACN
jgi:4-amino-4-deoxy-L-arabinose transferase-like glycosyltransferase